MKNEYNTRQRVAILDYLQENTTHTTVRDIISHLSEQGIKVGVTTAYRTLEKLCEQGVVRKFIIDERSGACYQYAQSSNCHEHFHLKCVKCGKLIHLSCDFLMQMENHILNDHGFTVSSGKTVIYGVCAECNEGFPSSVGSCSCSH